MGFHVLFSFALTPLRFRVAKGLRLACKRASMRLQKGCDEVAKGLLWAAERAAVGVWFAANGFAATCLCENGEAALADADSPLVDENARNDGLVSVKPE